MDPVTGIVAVIALIAALASTGCDELPGPEEYEDIPYDAGEAEEEDSDSGTSVIPDGGTDTDTVPDPSIRDGFNGYFYQCQYSTPCSVVDIDPEDESADLMTILAGFSHNRKGQLTVDSEDPMAAPSSYFAGGVTDFLGAHVNGHGNFYPYQIVKMADGRYFVPSDIVPDVGDNMEALLSMMDPDVSGNNVTHYVVDHYCDTWTAYTDECASLDTAPEVGEVIHPKEIMSGVMVGGMLYVVGSSEYDGSGMIVAYEQNLMGEIDVHEPQMIIPTSGSLPSAIEHLGGNEVAVLNTESDTMASIDIIDVTTGEITSTISLGVLAAYPLPEIAMNADKSLAFVAGGNTAMDARLCVVDMVGHAAMSVTSILEDTEVRDMEVLDDKVYVSVDDGSSSSSSGRAAIFDVSTPSAPVLDDAIDVGYDAGAIMVHGSGTVYMVVTDRWWEEPGTAEERWSHVVAFDPSEVTD